MLRTLMSDRVMAAMLVLCLLSGESQAGNVCRGKTAQAQHESEAAAPPFLNGLLRLVEGPSGNRGCAENCVAQCRQAQSSCSGDGASCRAAFQICARRCVVSCGTSR
jgi:hypothetical protein